MSDEVLRELAAQQARTNALLEALTHEVREGFERGRVQFEDQRHRISSLEHTRTRHRTILGVFSGFSTVAALAVILDKVIAWLSPS